MRKAENLTGLRRGMLTVVEREGSEHRNATWKTRCDCGNVTVKTATYIKTATFPNCGCQTKRMQAKAARERITQTTVPIREWYSQYRRNAKSRDIEFDLSYELFMLLSQQNCFYCGIEPSKVLRDKYGNRDTRVSGIDRYDNNQGYVPHNVVPACKMCNTAKNVHSVSDFQEWALRLSNSIQNQGLPT